MHLRARCGSNFLVRGTIFSASNLPPLVDAYLFAAFLVLDDLHFTKCSFSKIRAKILVAVHGLWDGQGWTLPSGTRC